MTLESGDQAHQRKASSVRVRLPRIWGLLRPYRWHVVATVTAEGEGAGPPESGLPLSLALSLFGLISITRQVSDDTSTQSMRPPPISCSR